MYRWQSEYGYTETRTRVRWDIVALVAVMCASIAFIVVGCAQAPVVPWPPPPAPPVTPTPPPTPLPVEPPPSVPGLPAVGSTRAQVAAVLGQGTDIPENPGEKDAVVYIVVLDGAPHQVHVIFDGDVAVKVTPTRLIVAGG